MSSQFNEDAILARIFGVIGTTNRIAVEIGARDGVTGSNTHVLRTRQGWSCVLLDAHPTAPIVSRAFVTAENINRILYAHGVPPTFDLLSIDVDGNDFHLWRALSVSTPRVVVIEYNSRFGPEASVVMPYDAQHHWDRTDYYGASAAALTKLAHEKGYTLVDAVPRANLFFVRDVDAARLPAHPVPSAEPFGYPASSRPWEAY